ncbi:Hsp70 family protein, partial [Candidatus Nomurabacteria bacterium]|nr:Hsp70 family protein [Candidatus Nomurabacteria bacterium]
ADQTVYTAEKSLRDYAEKVPAELKTSIEAKIKEVQEVKDKDVVADIETKTQELSAELSKIGELLQQQSNEAQPEKPAEEATEKPEEDNTDKKE